MYNERMRRNFKAVLEKHGVNMTSRDSGLKSISSRHIHNVIKGQATITVKTLEEVADEIGADMMDFFKVVVPFK